MSNVKYSDGCRGTLHCHIMGGNLDGWVLGTNGFVLGANELVLDVNIEL
jgi:hypothetical protein